MSKQKNTEDKEAITVQKLKRAFNLIKQERYAAARHVLKDVADHPKAQQMLAHIDGKVEKRKTRPAISGQTILVVMGVLAIIGGVIFAAWAIPTYLGQYNLADLALVGSGATTAEDILEQRARTYCYIYTDYTGDCEPWTARITGRLAERAEECFLRDNPSITMDPAEVDRITACLRRQNINRPS